MNLLFPLKQALNNPVGDVLLFLLAAIAVLLSFYFYFWLRFARQKDLTKCHYHTFKRTEKELDDLTFEGLASTDIFGKKQIVSLADGRYGRSLIFYPELYSEELVRRFEEYHLLLQQSSHSQFSENIIGVANNQLVNVETQFLKSNGETLINFAQHHLDHKLSDAEKEHFLIDLAYTLEALHQLKTESGETLYHGFLLPSSFYFAINLVKKITNIYLSDHGCVFALGSEKFQKWLRNFFLGKYIVDAEVKRQLLLYGFIFSPEQKEGTQEITAASDFYSYAALAVYVFTEATFENTSEIQWDLVPKSWRIFLKECLQKEPSQRPINFLELQEYFNDPDLLIETSSQEAGVFNNNKTNLSSIKGYFDQAHEQQLAELAQNKAWQQGYQAIKEKNWDEALEIFEEMKKESAQAFEANLGLSLLYLQKGESSLAKEFYNEAKKIDAKKIRYFQRLIAFDI